MLNQIKIKLKKNDMVQVIKGKDSGKTGKVLRILKAKNKLIVEKINMFKKHSRPTKTNPQGGIVEKEFPIALANVLLLCNKCGKGVRTGIKLLKNNTKVRYCKKCKEVIDK